MSGAEQELVLGALECGVYAILLRAMWKDVWPSIKKHWIDALLK